MYLTYTEYAEKGGQLEESAFNRLETKAERLINSQSAGKTGERIGKLTVLPEAIKDCTFDLISLLSSADADRRVSSESQSQGGMSESVSYELKSKGQIDNEIEDTILNSFYGAGLQNLLYWGFLKDD